MILVTGGTGFIGTHLLETLAARGEPVRALVRPTRVPRALPQGVEVVHGDLSSGAGLAEALGAVHTVIHLAGVTKALRQSDYYAGNVRATEQLALAMAGTGIRLVHVSSLAAMGPNTPGAPLTEDSEPHPISHYGRSKLEAERVVRRLVPGAVIVRPPVVYGPRDTDVFQLLKSISKGLVLEISGGERWFSALYVKDLVEGLLAAAAAPAAAGTGGLADGEYDCGGGYTYRAMGKVDIQGATYRYRPYDEVVNGFQAYSVTDGHIQWSGQFGGLDDPPARIVDSTVEPFGFNVQYQGEPGALINTMS